MATRSTRKGDKARRGATAIEETPIAIRSRIDVSARVEREVRSGLAAQLAPHATLIERVTVRFDDVNGPKGGDDDIVCEIKAVISGLPSVIVTDRAGSPAAAFGVALPRLTRVLRKELDRRGRRARPADSGRGTARRAAAGRAVEPPETLIGRGVGRGPEAEARALDRPEKRRGDAIVDTSQPGVSATDRKAGGAHTARRNTRGRTDGMTATLEDSLTRPSRKSTRRSANHGKPSQGKERNAVAQLVKPSARAARATARRGAPARR